MITTQTERGLKVCYDKGPGVLRLWIPFKHQLFIEYRLGGKAPLDVYDDVPGLLRNPKYVALVTKTFNQILIKDNKLEVHINLDEAELEVQSKKESHPELNHWLEEMAQILMQYNQNLPPRPWAIPLKIDSLANWMFKYFFLTIPTLAAIVYPFVTIDWKHRIQLFVAFGFVFGGSLIMLRVRLWLRIFTKFYIILLSGLSVAFIINEVVRRNT